MASGSYPLTARDCQRRTAWLAVAAVLVVAITTAVGWRGNHHPASAPSAAGPSSPTRPASAVGPASAAAPATGLDAGLDAGRAAAGRAAAGRTAAGRTAAGLDAGRAATGRAAAGRAATGRAATGRMTTGRMTTGRTSPTAAATSQRAAALSPADRRSCPPAASACVDLATQVTWLQSDGTVTYGPVRMEPGPSGTSHATPRGTFHVQWKAGPRYLSTEYHELMPYAVFFAPGGVAFHGGSLSTPSHGCVHLNINSARYYHDHLPVGAEVVVF